jgi:hypothetical protein
MGVGPAGPKAWLDDVEWTAGWADNAGRSWAGQVAAGESWGSGDMSMGVGKKPAVTSAGRRDWKMWG